MARSRTPSPVGRSPRLSSAETSAASKSRMSAKLSALRRLLKQRNLSGYVIPHNDAHFSEYLCHRDERLAYISDFDGSAGSALVTETKALLWTDGRYFLQAEKQLGIGREGSSSATGSTGWSLMRQGQDVTMREYLKKELLGNGRNVETARKIGMDPWLVSVREADRWRSELGAENVDFGITPSVPGDESRSASAKGPKVPSSPTAFFKSLFSPGSSSPTAAGNLHAPAEVTKPAAQDESNLIDMVRQEVDRRVPPRPCGIVREHSVSFAGASVKDKIQKLRKAMEGAENLDGCLICALDEIAWLLNLRGSDIPYNPVFFGWLLVFKDGTTKPVLYCDVKELHESEKNGDSTISKTIQLKPYARLALDLAAIRAGPGWKIFADPGSCPVALSEFVVTTTTASTTSTSSSTSSSSSSDGINIPLWKAVKNDTEISGMQNAHIRDGVAKTKFLMWLEDWFAASSSSSSAATKTSDDLTEVAAATQLENFRKREKSASGEKNFFQGLSFATISGSGANGAVIHYHPKGEVPIQRDNLFLVDSGAQYLDGTTDVTRTVYIPPASSSSSCSPPAKNSKSSKLANYRLHYTLVLKGHIGLATAVFPRNTPGAALDILARQHLWKKGLNYNHGTGHGVGSHLNVHEGPHGVPMLRPTLVKSAPQYLEVGLQPNMILSNEPGFYLDGEYGIRIENLVFVKEFIKSGYCCFENLTLVPLDKRLIETSLLNREEIEYVDAYHEEVFQRLKHGFAAGDGEGDARPYSVARLRRMTAPLVVEQGGGAGMEAGGATAAKRRKVLAS